MDKMGMDKMGIDKMGMDKMGIDKMGMDKMGIELSIIIPTHNKPERLRLALHSYLSQSYAKEKFEIVLVADGCTEQTFRELQAFENKLQLKVVESEQKGQSSARNLGVKNASGQFLAFFDDDILVCPEYLQTGVELLKKTPNTIYRGTVYTLYSLQFFQDPEFGVPYPQFEERIGKSTIIKETLISREMIAQQWELIQRQCRRMNRFERIVQSCLSPGKNGQIIPWMGMSGSGVMLNSDDFWGVKGYDEGLGLWWGAESVELGYRLWKLGKNFKHEPKLYSAHIDHPRQGSLTTYDKSFQYFFEKYQDPMILYIRDLIQNQENIEESLSQAL